MKCTITSYLEAEELQCRRIARSENEGTDSQREWLRTAKVLLERRREHVAGCKECLDAQIPIKQANLRRNI
jgi:hypothetical protein